MVNHGVSPVNPLPFLKTLHATEKGRADGQTADPRVPVSEPDMIYR